MADLRARRFSAQDFGRFDLILGMDDENIANIEALRPTDSDTRVACLADYVETDTFVPDPYYTRDFEGALGLIEACIDALIATESTQAPSDQ